MDESVERIGGYVSGNIFISVIAGSLAFVVMEILRVPYAAALGVWVAIADLIPGVGAMLGAVVCVVVALFSSIPVAIGLAVYFIVCQRIENYLILPRVMTKAIDLSVPTVMEDPTTSWTRRRSNWYTSAKSTDRTSHEKKAPSYERGG